MTFTRRAAVALTAASALLLPATGQAIPSPSKIRVAVNQYSIYVPGDDRYPELRLEVPRGGRLIFANFDSIVGAHTITELTPPDSFDPPRFDSPQVNSGQWAEVRGITNLRRGIYPFTCSNHSDFMRGTLHIV